MNYEKYLEDYLMNEKETESVSLFLMTGCMEQYLTAETEEEKNAFLSCLTRLTEKSGISGRNLFVLYDATKDESYRDKIEQKMEILRQWPKNNDGIFCEPEDSTKLMSWKFLYEAYPFYMAYETRFHNKADYASFILQTRKFEPALIRTVAWEDVCFLLNLIGVIDGMSKEIFEHYKSLQEIFKRTIKKIIPPLTSQEVDAKVGLAMGYVLVKACNIKIINSEKYAQTGLNLIEKAEEDVKDAKDADIVGLSMMAESIRRQFTKYD